MKTMKATVFHGANDIRVEEVNQPHAGIGEAVSRSFVKYLGPKHQFQRVMIVSGDRESEVCYLAEQVGLAEIYAQQSPEQKLALVRAETAKAKSQEIIDVVAVLNALRAAFPPRVIHDL